MLATANSDVDLKSKTDVSVLMWLLIVVFVGGLVAVHRTSNVTAAKRPLPGTVVWSRAVFTFAPKANSSGRSAVVLKVNAEEEGENTKAPNVPHTPVPQFVSDGILSTLRLRVREPPSVKPPLAKAFVSTSMTLMTGPCAKVAGTRNRQTAQTPRRAANFMVHLSTEFRH